MNKNKEKHDQTAFLSMCIIAVQKQVFLTFLSKFYYRLLRSLGYLAFGSTDNTYLVLDNAGYYKNLIQ